MTPTLILHVEDDENDAFLLAHSLKRAALNLTISHIKDGQTAMDYLAGTRQYADRATYPLPDLVLLDIKLPGANGLTVLAWIRAQPQFACLPVVMLTSSADPADINEAARLGANSYLLKSIDYLDVVNFLRPLASRAGGDDLSDKRTRNSVNPLHRGADSGKL